MKMGYRITALVALLTIVPHQVGAAEPGIAPPEALEKAIACSEENQSLAASFTLKFERSGQAVVSERYTVGTHDWAPVEGAASEFDKDIAKAWNDIKEQYGRIGGLVPRDISSTVKDLVFIEETDGGLVYSFTPGPREGQKPMSDTMIEALDRRFTIDRATMCMAGLTMKSTTSFKPAPIATIERFEISWQLAKTEIAPIPLVTGFSSSAAGTALFRKFDEYTQVTVSDVEISAGS